MTRVPVSEEVPVLGEPASVLEEPVLEESESVLEEVEPEMTRKEHQCWREQKQEASLREEVMLVAGLPARGSDVRDPLWLYYCSYSIFDERNVVLVKLEGKNE